MDHFEHYKNLMLQSQVHEIKSTIIENQDFLPQEAYEKLLLHIKISEDLLNNYAILNPLNVEQVAKPLGAAP